MKSRAFITSLLVICCFATGITQGDDKEPSSDVLIGKLLLVTASTGKTTGWAVQIDSGLRFGESAVSQIVEVDPGPNILDLSRYRNRTVRVSGMITWRRTLERQSHAVIVAQSISDEGLRMTSLSRPSSALSTETKSLSAPQKSGERVPGEVESNGVEKKTVETLNGPGKLETYIRSSQAYRRGYYMVRNPRLEKLDPNQKQDFKQRWAGLSNMRLFLLEKAKPLDQEREEWAAEDSKVSRRIYEHLARKGPIEADVQKYEEDVRIHNEAVEAFDRAVELYKNECTTRPLPPDEHDDCVRWHNALIRRQNELNTRKAELDKRRDALLTRIKEWETEASRLRKEKKRVDDWVKELTTRWEDFKNQKIFPWEENVATFTEELAKALATVP